MSLQVIGVGHGRTGTESMRTALEMLGYAPCIHMMVILSDPDAEKSWRRVIQDDNPDWNAVYQGWTASMDFPGTYYWRELLAHFPDAKAILTARDPDSWFDSISRTISPILDKLTDPESIGLKLMGEMVFDNRWHERDHMIAHYEKHNADVIAEVTADRLYIHNLGEGWDGLCDFLGKPIPKEPFPHTNTGEKFNEFFDARLSR